MYIGNVDGDGLYNLIWNLVDNVVERARAGNGATSLALELADEWITIRDDGPGLPVEMVAGTSALETLFTQLSRRSSFISSRWDPVIRVRCPTHSWCRPSTLASCGLKRTRVASRRRR